MSRSISISTVMLCWNRVELSRRVLHAYLETISVPYELIVANNASMDSTAEWLDSIEKDPRITAVRHSTTNDPAAALNRALEQCKGELLMVLENDYLLLPGWDLYALECFKRLPKLGQLSICTPNPFVVESDLEGLVKLARHNVVTSSVFPRGVFVDHGIRYITENLGKSRFPHDSNFSNQIRSLDLLVAWPSRKMAVSLGFDQREFARDPDYYLQHYRARVLDKVYWKHCLRQFVRLDFRRLWHVRNRLSILLKLHCYRLRAAARQWCK